MKIFQRTKLAIVAVLMIGSITVEASARDQGINGLLLGAGGGALAGQAIGRNTEGTLIGTAVGGVLGYMVGNEMDKGYGRAYGSAQPVVIRHPAPPPTPVFSSRLHYRDRYESSHRPHYRDRYESRKYYRPVERCREVVSVERRHGHYREVTRTVCRETDRWGHGRRGYWRGNHHDRDRW